jgi:DNA-binding PadR family transcriptional regulator
VTRPSLPLCSSLLALCALPACAPVESGVALLSAVVAVVLALFVVRWQILRSQRHCQLILDLLEQQPNGATGLGLVKLSGGELGRGTVYAHLAELDRTSWVDSAALSDDRARRVWWLTPAGRDYLARARRAAGIVTAMALLVLAGCGHSTEPQYFRDVRTGLCFATLQTGPASPGLWAQPAVTWVPCTGPVLERIMRDREAAR